jgi:hypothetical protein
MSARPAWLLHIPEIRSMLAEVDLPVIDRAVVERVFGLGRRQAIELLHRFGGFQAGRTFLIDRKQLMAALDQIIAGDEYQQERTRHEKLTAALAKLQSTRRAKEVRIEVSSDVFDSRMRTLPEAVHLEPGRLEVEFSGCEDLLTKLFALAQTALNDFEGFQKVSEGAGTGGDSAPPSR